MQRSGGVTASAVVVIIGSAFTLFVGAVMIFGSRFALRSGEGEAASLPAYFHSILIIESIITLGFGGWGLASGIGLIRLKQWARISLLVYAGILVFVCLSAAFVSAFIKLPNMNEPEAAGVATLIHVFMALFYAAFAVLGGFWLYFFNKKTVKAQFQPVTSAPELAAPLAANAASARVRPMSITIIGWVLLVTAPLGLLFLWLSAAALGTPIPLVLLGFFLSGRSAELVFIAWGAVQMAAAVGLLQLKRWAWYTSIGLQLLGVANLALLFAVPGNRARFHEMMNATTASMNARMPSPTPVVFPDWMGIVFGLPFVFVVLWFLIANRHAFTPAAVGPTPQQS